MDMDERKKKERQLIVATVLALAIFAAGLFLLPILTEKILLGVVLVLIAGALFFTNNTGRYICKRVLLALLTVFIIAAITFFSMNAIPGGPFSKEKAPSAAVQAVLEERFHLNEPVGKQFLLYLEGLMNGDFGISTKTGREISVTIFDSFAISAKLGGMAALLAIVLGVILGSIAALNRAKAPDRIIIFCERIIQAEEMARLLRRSYGNICILYHSGMTKEARERNLLLFRENSARVLVSCRCLDEGIDVPDANIGIVLSGSAVERQHIQRMGRLIRRVEGKDAACLYHISIREAAEDSAFFPGLNQMEKFSLRYYPAEKDFSNDLYEYIASTLLNSAKAHGLTGPALCELRTCLMEGMIHADCLLPESIIGKHIQTATATHEKNYWRLMLKVHQEFSKQKKTST